VKSSGSLPGDGNCTGDQSTTRATELARDRDSASTIGECGTCSCSAVNGTTDMTRTLDGRAGRGVAVGTAGRGCGKGGATECAPRRNRGSDAGGIIAKAGTAPGVTAETGFERDVEDE